MLGGPEQYNPRERMASSILERVETYEPSQICGGVCDDNEEEPEKLDIPRWDKTVVEEGTVWLAGCSEADRFNWVK